MLRRGRCGEDLPTVVRREHAVKRSSIAWKQLHLSTTRHELRTSQSLKVAHNLWTNRDGNDCAIPVAWLTMTSGTPCSLRGTSESMDLTELFGTDSRSSYGQHQRFTTIDSKYP